MEAPPITLFAKTADPDGVRKLVCAELSEADVDGIGGEWKSIFVSRARGIFRRERTLRINHSVDYYSGSKWAVQQAGIVGYFADFPMEDNRRATLESVIGEFCFSLAFVSDPPVSPGADDDYRYELMLKIAQNLDGCFFVPGYLLDAEGRVLVSAEGHDPDARFPKVDTPANPAAVSAGATTEAIPEEERVPPSAERVAARALVLAAVSARGLMELNASDQGADVENLESTRREALGWCSDLGILDEMEPGERRVLESPLGQLEVQDHLDSIWRFEGLAVLAWALGLHPLPAYDEVEKPDAILPVLGFLNAGVAREIIKKPELRPALELEDLSHQMFAYHWRMREFGLRPKAMDFKEFGQTCGFGPLDLTWAKFENGELALGGVALNRADPEIVETCSSIASERHLASNWLCGWSEVYSETDTPT